MAKSDVQRAIEQEEVEALRALLLAKAAIRPADLVMAASAASEAVALVTLLLEAGADPNAPDGHGTPPLHAAIDANRPGTASAEVIALLVRAGADVHARGQYGWSALQRAVARGEAGEVEALLEAGARVEETFPEGSPPTFRGRPLLAFAKHDPAMAALLRGARA